VVNGQFEVVRKLGEGGYGAVYEAKDVALERRIALKVMLPSRAASKEYVGKFFREARTAAQLVHPNVVAVHNVGLDRENNIYFLAMEYVEGRTLHDVLQERGPLPVEEAIDYMIQSCRGLAAAHERNIIHRDIKPGNLMIKPGGTIKIADFGLAKVYEGEGGAASTVIGTPYFMPPEQFEGKAKDGRTDIYALASRSTTCSRCRGRTRRGAGADPPLGHDEGAAVDPRAPSDLPRDSGRSCGG